MKRGLDAFPFPEMARRIWQEYFVPGGKAAEAPYPTTPMHQRRDLRKMIELGDGIWVRRGGDPNALQEIEAAVKSGKAVVIFPGTAIRFPFNSAGAMGRVETTIGP